MIFTGTLIASPLYPAVSTVTVSVHDNITNQTVAANPSSTATPNNVTQVSWLVPFSATVTYPAPISVAASEEQSGTYYINPVNGSGNYSYNWGGTYYTGYTNGMWYGYGGNGIYAHVYMIAGVYPYYVWLYCTVVDNVTGQSYGVPAMQVWLVQWNG